VLRRFAKESDALKRVLEGMPSSPEKPLDVVHYHDEVGAGHLLSPVTSRNFTSFRFSFHQMGRHLLTCDQMWFEYAVLRSDVLNQVKGGLSRVIALLMHMFFTCSTEGLLTLLWPIGLHRVPRALWGQPVPRSLGT
jgi:hypothetical protein